jgi:hypothetical protein
MYRGRYVFSERGMQNQFRGWGYQDFTAGAITTTSVTITANENGTDYYGSFSSSNIISNTAVCVRADYPAKKAYTGTTALFSTKVSVSAHSGASVTLSGVPHSTWGNIRIYYFYNYTAGMPIDYTIPSKVVAENLFAELQSLLISEEEIGDGSKDAVFSSLENTPIGATTPSTGAFTTLTANALRTAANIGTGSDTDLIQLTDDNVTINGSLNFGAGTAYIRNTTGPLIISAAGNVAVDSALSADDITINNPSNIYSLDHDSFSGFVTNEHIDWTNSTEDILAAAAVLQKTSNQLILRYDDSAYIQFNVNQSGDLYVTSSDSVYSMVLQDANVYCKHVSVSGTSGITVYHDIYCAGTIYCDNIRPEASSGGAAYAPDSLHIDVDEAQIGTNADEDILQFATGSLVLNGTLTVTGNLTDDTNTLTIANAKTAYDHSQDNTQAHGDYLLNNASDSTSGTLTAANLQTAGNLQDGTYSASVEEILTVPYEFVIDGGGTAITTGQKGHIIIPYACTIKEVILLADQAGSIKIDIWKDTYANFPPDNEDTITGGNEPEISESDKDQDSTLTDWTTSVNAGDILAFNVDSCSTIERCTVSLKVIKA